MAPKESQFVNRELSWLEFNQRVLDEATDPKNPLLERLKFLAITSSNLDEFFMVRVGGLQMLRQQGSTKRDLAGMTPTEQLAAISSRVRRMLDDQYDCLLDLLEPALAEKGVQRLAGEMLERQQRSAAKRIFEEEIFPIYTPMAVEPDDEFPLLVNRALNLAVRLEPAAGGTDSRFAIIPLSLVADRFFALPAEDGYQYVLLEDIAKLFVDRFFPGEPVAETALFRLTRNADMGVREDMAADLMAGMEEVLDARKNSECVRLEVDDNVSDELLSFLRNGLEVSDENVFRARGPLDLSAFMRLSGISGFDDLKYEAWPPRPVPDVDPAVGIFDTIAQRDVLVSQPYESFEPVIRLLDEAADDEQVLAIKITLYRTSKNSPIVAALQRAAENGKHVTAIVELKARFDEARNIGWAKALEQVGVQVIYGVKGLKTHGKVCIVIRREPDGIQRYVHFSTGNYNEVTARLYSDISLLTCNEELAADATNLFNSITGYSQPQQFRKIAMAPTSLRERLIELIDSEIDRKQQGQKAKIIAQVNSLADEQIIRALYRASAAGVPIQLNIRGICCLRPGVPGLSENIRAVSILDRYLEHSRIFYFHHGGDQIVLISSADWMGRNLDKRVELLVPVEDSRCKKRLIEILNSYAKDNVKGRELTPDGGYKKPTVKKKKSAHRHQQHLHKLALEAEREEAQSCRTVFEPHRAPSSVGN